MVILTYNGIIFKLSQTIEKDIGYLPEEQQHTLRWYLVKHWFDLLIKRNKYAGGIVLEFSKLSSTDRDNLLELALASTFNQESASSNPRAYIEVLI